MNVKSFLANRWVQRVLVVASIVLAALVDVTTKNQAVHLVWPATVVALLTPISPLWKSLTARDVFGPAVLEWTGFILTVGGGAATAWLSRSPSTLAPIGIAFIAQLKLALASPAPPLPPADQAGA